MLVSEGDGQREAALIEQLLSKDYSREARPLLNATKSMNVSVELEITDFSGLVSLLLQTIDSKFLIILMHSGHAQH